MTRYATYAGLRGRSLGALDAEASGRLPLTRAIPVVAARAGCTRREARAALIATHDGEWHHTGNRARRTDYYSVDAAVEYLRPGAAAEHDRRVREERIESLLADIADLERQRETHLAAEAEWLSQVGRPPKARSEYMDWVADQASYEAMTDGDIIDLMSLSNRQFAAAQHPFHRHLGAWQRSEILLCTQTGADNHRRQRAAACRDAAKRCELRLGGMREELEHLKKSQQS